MIKELKEEIRRKDAMLSGLEERVKEMEEGLVDHQTERKRLREEIEGLNKEVDGLREEVEGR